MAWDLDFISEENLKRHVANTIRQYGEKLQPFDLERFNKNIIDPIKLLFDKNVYNTSWEQIVSNEIFRQRDKSNNNDIGYFHQKIFQYIDHCEVPEAGWDVIYSDPSGIRVADDRVSTIYVEMKNKHNTMNSASSAKTYIQMQHQLLEDDDCMCFLVEAIAKRSQNEIWQTTVDGRKVSHRRIRRVSMDHFYKIVTGVPDAFLKLCLNLPGIIKDVLEETSAIEIPHDTVMDEINDIVKRGARFDRDTEIALAFYMLGFYDYIGFR